MIRISQLIRNRIDPRALRYVDSHNAILVYVWLSGHFTWKSNTLCEVLRILFVIQKSFIYFKQIQAICMKLYKQIHKT